MKCMWEAYFGGGGDVIGVLAYERGGLLVGRHCELIDGLSVLGVDWSSGIVRWKKERQVNVTWCCVYNEVQMSK